MSGGERQDPAERLQGQLAGGVHHREEEGGGEAGLRERLR